MKNKADEAGVNNSDKKPTTLDELRRILLGPEQKQIVQLRERLDDPELRAEDVSRVLAEAVALRSARDNRLAKALEPFIAASIKGSVKTNPHSIVDALAPAMGPSIWKAALSAVRGMIQSLKQIIEYTFSVQALKWRLEAFRTKKPFGEIVLAHRLVYQVEHVLLIHRSTGLVLQHVVAREVAAQDTDQVSTMSKALQDFVHYSYGTEKDEATESLAIDDRSICIEQGPRAILAAIIRGTPPPDLQVVLRDTIDTIHLLKSDKLESFDGDVTPFEELKSHLLLCLKSQLRQRKREMTPLLWVLLGGLVLIISLWFFFSIRDHRRWSNVVDRLRSEPGIVITAAEERSGKYHVFGLRDPLAAAPEEILKEANLNPENVVFQWETYWSLNPQFILKRAKKLLQPPETVSLDFKDGTLHAKGHAPHQWVVDAQTMAEVIPGVFQFNGDEIQDLERHPERILAQAKKLLSPPSTVSLSLVDNVLYANGSASHGWIVNARKQATSIPGIASFKEDNLTDRDLQNLETLKKNIENRSLHFPAASTKITANQEATIRELTQDIKQINDAAAILGMTLQIEITGHTDSSGNEATNMIISQRRAESVLSVLVSEGLQANYFITKGAGSKEPLKQELNLDDEEASRRVTFKVILADKRGQGNNP